MPHKTPASIYTNREVTILTLIAEGMSDSQIGQELNLSPKTINYHVENIKRKLEVKTRIQAVAYALRQRIID